MTNQNKKQYKLFCDLLFIVNKLDPKMPLKIAVERVQRLLSPKIFDYSETRYTIANMKYRLFNGNQG